MTIKKAMLAGVFGVLGAVALGYGIGIAFGVASVPTAFADATSTATSSASSQSSATNSATSGPCSCTLTASPNPVDYGKTTVLTWTTNNAKTFSIDNGIGAVTPADGGTVTTGALTSDTVFTATATGYNGKVVHCKTKVKVNPPPPPPPPCSCTLSASPASIQQGDSSKLTWTAKNAVSFSIDHGVGTSSPASGGSKNVSPSVTTTYTGTAVGANGKVVHCTTTVTVTPPPPSGPSCSLLASPTSVNAGDTSTLSWTTTNADTFSIDQSVGSVTPVASGTTTVSVATTTTYTGTATGPGGTVHCTTTVTVTPPPPPPGNGPSCTLSATPSQVGSVGDHATLSWTTTDGATFVIDQGVGSVSPVAAGTTTSKAINEDTSFTGTVTSPTGQTATCHAAVTIPHGGGGSGPVCELSASPTAIAPGGTSHLSWGGYEILNVDVDHGVATATSSPGGANVSPSSDTTYTGTFHADNGQTLTCKATVTVTGGGGGGCTGSSCGGTPSDPIVTLMSHPSSQPLSYLYLSQIPYTGLDLGPVGTTLYWAGLVLWSLALGYLVLFGAVPLAGRRLKSFGTNVGASLNAQAVAHAKQEQEEEKETERSGVINLSTQTAPQKASRYSAYEGFKSLADEGALTIDDIVKGLSRAKSVPTAKPDETEREQSEAIPEAYAAEAAAPVEPIYENVEPVYENVEPVYENVEPVMPEQKNTYTSPRASHPQAASAQSRRGQSQPIAPEVPAFLEALLGGNRDAVFGMIRDTIKGGGDAESFLTQVACALDDAYRSRIEGAPVHPDIARVTESVATPVLEQLTTAITTAVDSSYSIGITGAKLALTRALAVLGA